jgi:hypothetical protein
MEAIYSSEMLVDFQRTTRRDIPEGRTLQYDRRENLKSHRINYVLSMNFIICVTILLLGKRSKHG